GGGNLGVALAIGISKYTSEKTVITRRNFTQIQYLEGENVMVSSNNLHQIQEADIIILTVKPYQVDAILTEILPHISNAIIASAVSGYNLQTLEEKAGNNSVVRIMPNIAAQFAESATCISFTEKNREAGMKVAAL